MRDIPLAKDAVGKLGAGFEGEFLGEDKRVVAVKEEVRNLVMMVSLISRLITNYFTFGILKLMDGLMSN